MAADASAACARCRTKGFGPFPSGTQQRGGERTEGSAMTGADLLRLLASRDQLHSK